jgi:hypothetical protein
MNITPQDIEKVFATIGSALPSPPLGFFAFCYTCDEVNSFLDTRCEKCNDIWKPLLEYVEKNKSIAAS